MQNLHRVYRALEIIFFSSQYFVKTKNNFHQTTKFTKTFV